MTKRATPHSKALAKRNREIVRMVKSGKTYQEVGDKFNLTRARIGMIVNEAGATSSREVRHQKEIERARRRIASAAKHGKSSVDLSEKYGRSPSWWEKQAREAGILIKNQNGSMMRMTGEAKEQRDEEIVQYLNEGHTQVEATKKFGMVQGAISGIALRNGIRRRLTGDMLKERNEKVLADMEDGMTADEICEKYGISRGTLYVIKSSADIDVRPHEDIEARNAAILEDLNAGMSRHEVAKKHHTSLQTVCNIINQNKLAAPVSNKRRKWNRQRKQMVADRKNGMTIKDMCDKYEISSVTLYGILREEGLVKERKKKGDDE